MYNYDKRRKFCKFKFSNIKDIDYKDVDLLKNYITECSKIIPGRITGVSAKFQRKLSIAIKRARYLALLTYTDLHK